MSSSPKPGMVYVLPNYDPDTGSHFFHIYELISRAAGDLGIKMVIERMKEGSQAPGVAHYCQRFSFPPLRFLELLLVLTKECFSGRRFFYTHYSFYGALASWLVAGLFGGTAYYWNCGMPWLYRRHWFEEAIFRFILRHTILVTGTVGLADEYCRRYGLDRGNTRVVPNWVNISRFKNAGDPKHFRERLGIPIDAKIALFVHRLSRRKGVHLLPEIISEVIRLRSNASVDSEKHEKNVMFLIVGSGPGRQKLESKIKNLELEPHVRLVGEVPQREIPVYFQAADILLMPSEEEGFPHVLLEAMASGVPYVASDVGGVREITPPELNSYLVATQEPKDYANAVEALLDLDSGRRVELTEKLIQWVGHYDLERVVPQFVALFHEDQNHHPHL